MFYPTYNNVLIKVEDQSTTASGIVLASAASDVLTGTVVETGPGYTTDAKSFLLNHAQPGLRAMFPSSLAHKVTIEEEEYYIVRDNDIILLETDSPLVYANTQPTSSAVASEQITDLASSQSDEVSLDADALDPVREP